MSGTEQLGTGAGPPDGSGSAYSDGALRPHDATRRSADRLARQNWSALVRHAEIELGVLEDEAEDLVQDVFASILAGEVCMRTVLVSSELPYMKQVIRQRARNWRRRRRHRSLEESHPPIERRDPWRQAVRIQVREELEEAFAVVPPHQRRVMIESCFEGRSTREIAEREGISEAAVRQRLARARRKFKACLGTDLELM